MNHNSEIFSDIFFDNKDSFIRKIKLININDKESIMDLLIYSTQQNKEWAILYLLDYGAPKNATLLGGSSLINYAAASGMLDLIRYLISKGIDVNNIDEDGTTPLHNALVEQQYKVAKELVLKGANINLPSYGVTPAEYIKRNQLQDLIEIKHS